MQDNQTEVNASTYFFNRSIQDGFKRNQLSALSAKLWNRKLTGIELLAAELAYKSKYVCDLSLPLKNGDWSDKPAAIFYNPEPDVEKGHSKYFGLLRVSPSIFVPESVHDRVYITSADFVKDIEIPAISTPEGELLYSCCRHDYQVSSCGNYFIDGGLDYTRYGCKKENPELVKGIKHVILQVQNGNLVFKED